MVIEMGMEFVVKRNPKKFESRERGEESDDEGLGWGDGMNDREEIDAIVGLRFWRFLWGRGGCFGFCRVC